MSPGLRSRPSLSASLSGITVPAFVERLRSRAWAELSCGVAGITVPAFVERTRGRPWVRAGVPEVSPGLRSRPSLSAERPGVRCEWSRTRRVAGITVPAFVERTKPWSSPPRRAASVAGITVPAFVERTRARIARERAVGSSVAGITVPAFVEREQVADLARAVGSAPSVAGITVPAFVERDQVAARTAVRRAPVSPGLRSRPSLSAQPPRESRLGAGRVSPGLRSRPSLSAVTRGSRLPLDRRVSPGLRFRPSLSALHRHYQPLGVRRVSPGLRSRPSLSGIDRPSGFPCHISVAGIAVPAFVKFKRPRCMATMHE